MNKIQAQRLMNVARALRESANPERFTMKCLLSGEYDVNVGSLEEQFCGTPACALGHYGARQDLQKLMKVRVKTYLSYLDNNQKKRADLVYTGSDVSDGFGLLVSIDDDEICDHFGIDTSEAFELFDSDGCGDAKTVNEAADYIEDFVSRKQVLE